MITNSKEKQNKILDEMELVYTWSKGTKTNYTIALNSYTTFHHASFNELIREAENDEENNIKRSKRRIKQRLIQYRLHLQKEDYKPNTIKMYMAMIQKMYKYNDIDIPPLPPIRVTQTETFEDIPTHQEITKAITNSRTKNKALITFIASTGLRRSDVAKLTIQNFIDATVTYHENKYNDLITLVLYLEKQEPLVPTWNITDKKTGINHLSFSSHESSMYILVMLKERILLENACSNDLLFNIKPDSISKNFRNLNTKLGMGWKETRRHFHPHALRKYFATTLTSHDVDYLSTQFLLGHSIGSVDRSYYFANPERLRNKYIRVMEHLTFTMRLTVVDVNSREKRELRELRQYKEESNQRINQLEEMVNFLSHEL